MPRPIQLTIHLGAHKTATTHLQRSIHENRELIIAAGVRAYEPEYLRHRGRSIPAMFGLQPWAKNAEPRRKPADQLEFLAKGGFRVFLSEENFLGPLHSGDGKLTLPLYGDAGERIASLAATLPNARIKLFLSIRRPDTFLASSYSQTLFSGEFLSPQEFIEAHPISVVDWVPVVRGLAEAEGIEQVVVWRYEDYTELFPFLMRRMLRWKLGNTLKPFARPLHQGLSGRAMRHLMNWKAEGKGGPLATDARRKFPVSEQTPKFELFDDAIKAEAAALYDAQIAAIRGIEKVDFITPDDIPGRKDKGEA